MIDRGWSPIPSERPEVKEFKVFLTQMAGGEAEVPIVQGTKICFIFKTLKVFSF